jgi:hypothetical protein
LGSLSVVYCSKPRILAHGALNPGQHWAATQLKSRNIEKSPGLRKNVQRAVNRGEEYHQLRRAIAYAHGGRFRVRSQHEQEIWNECARLVANVVVYYNALILSEVLDELQKRGEIAAIEILKRVSPIAWQHINFYGHYRFDADFSPIDLAAIRQHLFSEEVRRFYTA